MSLLFYQPDRCHNCRGFLRMVMEISRERRAEILKNRHSLLVRLRTTPSSIRLAVICTPDRKELDELVAIRELFRGVRMILVLPDDGAESVRLGHLLRPRYHCFCGDPLANLQAVIRKILNHPDPVTELFGEVENTG